MNFGCGIYLQDKNITDNNLNEKITSSLTEIVGGSSEREEENSIESLVIAFNELKSLVLLLRFSSTGSSLFSNLTRLDVRHNQLKSFEGCETLLSLKVFMGCHNSSVKTLLPLFGLPSLVEVWASNCGIVPTDALKLIETQTSSNVGFKPTLRVLVIKNTPLGKEKVTRPLLVGHLRELVWLDDTTVDQEVRESCSAFLGTSDGSGMMHRLRAQLRTSEPKKNISSVSGHTVKATVRARRPSEHRTNDGQPTQVVPPISDNDIPIVLDNSEQPLITNDNSVEMFHEQRNCQIEEQLTDSKVAATEIVSSSEAEDVPLPVELASELTLSNCLDGLGADIDKLLKLSPQNKPKKGGTIKKKKKLDKTQIANQAGSTETSSDITPCDLILKLNLKPAAASTLYYPRTNDKGRSSKSKPQGPVALVVRADQSASAKWPSGGTAVVFMMEAQRPSVSAFFSNGGLAVMVDTRGCGSANYSSGKTALSISPTGGFINDEDGSILQQWSNVECAKEMSITLGEGLGIVCSLKPKAGAFISLFFQCRNLHAVFSQDTSYTSLLEPGKSLFGSEPVPHVRPKRERTRANGVRALEAEAAALPPISHYELIAGLRGAIADL